MGVSVRRRLVSRLWVPTLAAVVVVLAGFVIDTAHGTFGSKDRTRSPGNKFSIAQFNPKRIEYDIFGELAGWGRVSYWDVNSHAVAVDLAALPWTHTEVTVLTTATADITAQVAGGNVGCRITVDGQVRSEHIATGEHAGVWCQVLSA
ncbi:MmpS family transport accessory protein [Mycobacterium sp. 1245805.9]|uniref:MmpS family transport accessory protein n=1 Tax=Mycobacterium sp. 1245805.9 TaxID=1856862 RepID=UPI0007FFD1AA|nr:MmpS family transport accessory protein [Mycobacterium sp. 1245805.9]OBI87138.1 MmpS protein [Mycobacterium sp. 1245805.9]